MVTIISHNLKKTSERIDPQGNIINPKTKQVIAQNNQEYIPSPEELARVDNTTQPDSILDATASPMEGTRASSTPKSIQEEINATKAKLAQLEEKKKQKIEEMKRELEELEK